MKGTHKELNTAPFSRGAGPSQVLHTKTTRPHTPRKTCHISHRNRPFLYSRGHRGFSDLWGRSAGVGLPRWAGGGASLLLPFFLQGLPQQSLRSIPLLWGCHRQACWAGHVVKELKPHWGIWQGRGLQGWPSGAWETTCLGQFGSGAWTRLWGGSS